MSSEEKLALIDKIYADGFEVEPKEEHREGHYYGLLSAIYSVIHFEGGRMISDTDTNIMELCFHNGEQHMKEKVLKLLMGYFRASGSTVGPVYEHIISEVEKL